MNLTVRGVHTIVSCESFIEDIVYRLKEMGIPQSLINEHEKDIILSAKKIASKLADEVDHLTEWTFQIGDDL